MSSSTSQSSAGPSSGSTSPIEAERLPSHRLPLSSPISAEDLSTYTDLITFEEAIFDLDRDDEVAVNLCLRMFSDLRQRMESLESISQATFDLYGDVLTIVEEMLVTYEDNDANLATVQKQLNDNIKRIAEEELTARGVKKVKKSSSPTTTHSIKAKPFLQSRRLPSDLQKTHRKRRVESGIPGQESLKFRPCRDFFMDHLNDPYPNASQKNDLMRRANISAPSLNQWFTNTRRRSGWMDIMKNHANNRKEDMRVLVDRALDPESRYPMPEDVRAAVRKMRKYVDELAREVVSTDFMDALNHLQRMDEAAALRWQEQQRMERKRVNQIKKEQEPAVFAQDDRSSSLPRIQPKYQGVGAKRRRDPSPAPPSSSTAHSPVLNSEAGSPSKRARVTSDSDDEPHEPPKNLHQRRLGVPDLAAPLSAASTFVASEPAETPSSSFASLSPFPTLGQQPTLTEQALGAADDSGMITVSVPANEASVDPSLFRFDLLQFMLPSDSRSANCSEWAHAVSQTSPESAPSPTSTDSSVPSPLDIEEPVEQFWTELLMQGPSTSGDLQQGQSPAFTETSRYQALPMYTDAVHIVPASSDYPSQFTAPADPSTTQQYPEYTSNHAQSSHQQPPTLTITTDTQTYAHYSPAQYSAYPPQTPQSMPSTPSSYHVPQSYPPSTTTYPPSNANSYVAAQPPAGQDVPMQVFSSSVKPDPYGTWDPSAHDAAYGEYHGGAMMTQESFIQPMQSMYYAS